MAPPVHREPCVTILARPPAGARRLAPAPATQPHGRGSVTARIEHARFLPAASPHRSGAVPLRRRALGTRLAARPGRRLAAPGTQPRRGALRVPLAFVVGIEDLPAVPLRRGIQGGAAGADQAPRGDDGREPAAFDLAGGEHGISAPSAAFRGGALRPAGPQSRPPGLRRARRVRRSRSRSRARHGLQPLISAISPCGPPTDATVSRQSAASAATVSLIVLSGGPAGPLKGIRHHLPNRARHRGSPRRPPQQPRNRRTVFAGPSTASAEPIVQDRDSRRTLT